MLCCHSDSRRATILASFSGCAAIPTVIIARDRTRRSLCRPIGEGHLAVSPNQEPRFRKALIARGHVVPGRSLT